MKTTKAMRDRLRELSRKDGSDDYDRVVVMVVDDLEEMLASQYDAAEQVISRMGWPEINAYHEERARGQSVYEDAGSYVMRCIGRLLGVKPRDEVVTYREAARAMIEKARATH